MLDDKELAEFRRILEQDGEEKTRIKIAQKVYGEEKTAIALEWLKGQQEIRNNQSNERMLAILEKISSPVQKGIIEGIIPMIILAFLCWMASAVYANIAKNEDLSHERLEHFLMYADMRYPSQLLVSALSPYEQLTFSKRLLIKDKVDPLAKTPVYPQLKAEDVGILRQRIRDVEIAERSKKLLLLVGLPVAVLLLGSYLWHKKIRLW